MNSPSRFVLVGLLILVLGAPLLLGSRAERAEPGARRLVVITPHMEHLRYEFARGFREWHLETYGEPVVIDFRQPGGTSEIRKQLLSQYAAAVSRGDIGPDGAAPDGTMPYDLLFGGGSYEHDQLKNGVEATVDGERVRVPLSVPLPVSDEQLYEWFGENRIGALPMYDPEKYWVGAALSSFGIVYNRDVIERLGIERVPASWDDLADHRYVSWLALSDPRQSGSVSTTYESILNNYGWDDGWRILRAMCANAQYFSNWSTKAPVDVSRGEAAAGVAIDFYGRYQSQAARQPGQSAEESRVGFVDPEGNVLMDPDPISMMRGGPDPDLALRFIEFVMTEEGQALWQFPLRSSPEEMGPEQFELRRLPARRVMYEKHFDRFVDKVQPYAIASTAESRGWRSMISPLFGAFAIDIHHEQREAWEALAQIEASGDAERIAEAEALFYAWPMHEFADGRRVRLSEETYSEVRNDWRDPARAAEHKIAYTAFFRDCYNQVIRMADGLDAEHGAELASEQH